MGSIDIILYVFILLFAFRGALRGLINESISILGIILAFLFSYIVYTPIYKLLLHLGMGESVTSVVTYILGFLLIYILVIIIGSYVSKAIEFIRLGWVNKAIGFFFGGLKGAVIASLILWAVLYFFPSDLKFVKEINQSKTAKSVQNLVPYLYGKLNSISGKERFNPFTEDSVKHKKDNNKA